MGGGDGNLDCPAMNDEGAPAAPKKCDARDCNLRSGGVATFAVSISFIAYSFPLGTQSLRPDTPDFVSAAGKPPLRPPRASLLA